MVLGMEAESIFGRRTAQALGLVVLLLLVVGLLLVLLGWYIDPRSAAERNELIRTSAQILGGTALLWGLYFTWRTLQVNRGGQITDRFTRAIDQLGASEGGIENVEARMGGIYALERIAKESAEDYWPIMEILAAYIKHRAPRQTTADSEDSLDEFRTVPGHKYPDVQACLTVIGRRSQNYAKEPKRLNLERTDLDFVDLPRANLTGIWLSGATLTRANLWLADLRRGSLRQAHLWNVYLRRADLTEADLRGADLTGADLREVDFWKADLTEADLTGANVAGAFLAVVRGLTQVQLDVALGDKDTMLPPDLERPKHWLIDGIGAKRG